MWISVKSSSLTCLIAFLQPEFYHTLIHFKCRLFVIEYHSYIQFIFNNTFINQFTGWEDNMVGSAVSVLYVYG